MTLRPHRVYGCVKKKGFTRKQGYKTVLNENVLRQIELFNNTSSARFHLKIISLYFQQLLVFLGKNVFLINSKCNCEISVKRTTDVKRKIRALF